MVVQPTGRTCRESQTWNMEGKQWKTLDVQIPVVKDVKIREGLRGRLGGS